MKIFSASGVEILDVIVEDNSYRYRAIMGEHSLTLYYSLPNHVEIPIGSYCDFQGERFTLKRPENIKKHHTRDFAYTLILDSGKSNVAQYKFRDTEGRLKFSLTAKPIDHLSMFVDNMNRRESGWTVGTCIDAVEKTISYNHASCLDALTQQATEFETEYEFNGKVVSLRKVEYNKSNPLPLSYGKGNGFKSGVGRVNDGDKPPIDILFVQGGEKNIDFSKYGSRDLLLPIEQTFVYDGKEYVTDSDGLSLRRKNSQNSFNEGSLDLSHIYPSRTGVVSTVTVIDEEKHLYDFTDSTIPEALDYSELQIEGETLTVVFQSGILAGREFEVHEYVHEEDIEGVITPIRRFELVPIEIDGITMPDATFKPAVGDKYAVFGMMMPEAYICDNATQSGASWDMFKEAARYLSENEDFKFTFTGELDGIWSKKDWLTIGGKIKLGGYVEFTDTQFQPDGILIRITGIKDYINKPYSPIIELATSISGPSIKTDIAKIKPNEQEVEEYHKDAIRFTKRRFRDALETITMLEDSLLDFSGSIDPITVRTMQLLVGDESLQFRFVTSKTAPSVAIHNVSMDNETKTLTVDAGIIQHLTLGIKTISNAHKASDYKYWDLAKYVSPPLIEAAKRYYLYARVSETDESGEFILSENAIKINESAGYYHLLTGILNSEHAGERSFVSLYGFTEILPGRITTDKIVSADGKTYFDLLNGIIGGKISFRSTGGSDEDLAEILDGVGSDIQDTQGLANTAALKAQQAIDDAEANVTLINQETAKLQQQIDGEISNYYQPYKPTLSNHPASDWTTNLEKDRHIGDLFLNIQDYVDDETTPDAGKVWRFIKDGTTYLWTPIADSDSVKAMKLASLAQATADGKSTTFLIQPTKYHLGDMWVLNADQTVNGTAYKSGEILTATQDSETFVQAHWLKRIRYTDDTAIDNLEIGGRNYFSVSFPDLTGNYSKIMKLEPNTEYIISNDFGKRPDNGFYMYVGSAASVNGIEKGFPKRFTTDANGNIEIFFRLWVLSWLPTGEHHVMLQKGTKATDWSPAPEDTESKILEAQGYMKARYIRAWSKGNSVNNRNDWNEIKVINKQGVNIAKGKWISANGAWSGGLRATDEDIYTTTYVVDITTPPTHNYLELDLLQVYYDIDFIQIWHYWQDGRTYFGTKTEISEDGTNWVTIFDSATEGTYKETAEGKIHTQRYASVMAKLVETSAKTKGFTRIGSVDFDSGLIFSNLMKLFDVEGSNYETAFFSGITGVKNDLPAFGAGSREKDKGVYQQAIDGTAGVIFRHDGTGKIGVFEVDKNGAVKIFDPDTPSLLRLKFIKSKLPPVADLLASTGGSGSTTNTATTRTTVGTTVLVSSINVTVNGSELNFTGNLMLNVSLLSAGLTGFASVTLQLLRNDSVYATLYSIGSQTLRDGDSTFSTTDSVNETITVPTGTYKVSISLVLNNATGTGGTSGTSTLSWLLNNNINEFIFGSDGFTSWHPVNSMYHSEDEGLFVRGAQDIPGVLASGSVSSTGVQTNVWGAKSSSYGAGAITGGRSVPLSNLTHNSYSVIITPHTATTFRVGAKATTSFQALGTGGFDYVVIGNNY